MDSISPAANAEPSKIHVLRLVRTGADDPAAAVAGRVVHEDNLSRRRADRRAKVAVAECSIRLRGLDFARLRSASPKASFAVGVASPG